MNPTASVQMLLVEDSPHDAELTVRALRRAGLANGVVHLRDGEEVIAFFRQPETMQAAGWSDGPGLILMDWKLPRLSGVDLVKQLRAQPVTRVTPLVVFSSSQEESDVQAAYDAGVNAYVVKPAEYDRLAETICQTFMFWLGLNHMPSGSAPETIGENL